MTYKQAVQDLRATTIERIREKLEDPECDPKWAEVAFKYLKEAGIIALEQDAGSQAQEFLAALPTFEDPDDN